MTEVMQGVVEVVAPEDQRVAVPAVPEAVQVALTHLTPEYLAEAAKGNRLVGFAKEASAAYVALGTVEDQYKRRRTVAGAYVHRAMSLAGKAPKDIGALLGVSSGRVTQLRDVARLHLDLGIAENEGDFGAITGKLLNNKQFRAAFNAEDATGEKIVALAADILRPVASVGGSESDSGSAGADTATRGADAAPQTFERWNSNAKRLDNLESLVAALTDLSPAEWARLFGVRESIAAVLRGSSNREAGAVLVKAEADKRAASESSAETVKRVAKRAPAKRAGSAA